MADDAARLLRGEEPLWFEPSELAGFEPAQQGDVWRIHWHSGPLAGYAITCPKCKQVHQWTTALNCREAGCPHNGVSSCWKWTGSPEEGTLTASPSLHCVTEWKGNPTGGCGWHGHLSNGQMVGI